jgi:SAM-dependent methyltransferase
MTRSRIDISDLYDDSLLTEIARGRRLVEWTARQMFLRYFGNDRRPYREIVGEKPTGSLNSHYFRKRLIDYLIDKEDLSMDGNGTLTAVGQLAAMKGGAEPTEPVSRRGYELQVQLLDVVNEVLLGEDGFKAIGTRHDFGVALDNWIALMVDLPVRRPGTVMAARALTARLERGPVVCFEGGAGVGAILRHALAMDAFRQRIGNISEYHFTDISPLLLSMGQDWLQTNAPPELFKRIKFDIHDLDRTPLHDVPFTAHQSVDAILLEGVLYDVCNLHEVLCAFRRMLRPGGILAFTMAFRQRPAIFFPCEILQSSLHSYYRAKLDPPLRMNYG